MRTVKVVRKKNRIIPKDLLDEKRNTYIQPIILKDKEDSQMYEIPEYLAIGILGHGDKYCLIGDTSLKLRVPFPTGTFIMEYFPWEWDKDGKRWKRTKKDINWTEKIKESKK